MLNVPELVTVTVMVEAASSTSALSRASTVIVPATPDLIGDVLLLVSFQVA